MRFFCLSSVRLAEAFLSFSVFASLPFSALFESPLYIHHHITPNAKRQRGTAYNEFILHFFIVYKLIELCLYLFAFQVFLSIKMLYLCVPQKFYLPFWCECVTVWVLYNYNVSFGLGLKLSSEHACLCVCEYVKLRAKDQDSIFRDQICSE